MKKVIGAALQVLLIPVPASALFAGSGSREGLWEITSTLEMPGMPVAIPPSRFTRCMRGQDMVPKSPQSGDSEYRVVVSRSSGNTAAWTMKCSVEGAAL